MTRYQHAKRIALWRGSGIFIAVFTTLMLLSALADRITS